MSCHDGNYQFDLREDAAKTGLVNTASGLYAGETLVVPGDPDSSLLYKKLFTDLEPSLGVPMPLGALLNDEQIQLVEDWITTGASTDCGEEPTATLVPLNPKEHLRRVAMALLGHRPSPADITAVEQDPDNLDGIIDDYMTDPAFGETVRDLHNDAMLVNTVFLFQLFYPAIGPLATLTQTNPEYADARRINRELQEVPLRTAEYIVATDQDYRDIVSGNYIVGNPVFEAVYGDGSVQTTTWYTTYEHTVETGATYVSSADPYGVGPDADFDVYQWPDERGSAGLMTTNAFLQRWQSAGANQNRGRANAATKAFLCFDYLAQPVDVSSEGGVDLSDPDAVALALTDTGSSCWGCHATLDPLATYFQPYRPASFSGTIGLDGYPYSMYNPVFHHNTIGALNMRQPSYFEATNNNPNPVGADLDGNGRVDAGDLGRHMADDPRFSSCTVKRFYSFFTQTELSAVPADVEAELVEVLESSGYSAKTLIKAILHHPSFTTSHTADDVGAEDVNGLLRVRPSQMARLYNQTVGVDIEFLSEFPIDLLDPNVYGVDDIALPYGMTDYIRDDFIGFRELFGGIDSFNVTRPVRTFTGGTASAARWIGNFGGWYAVVTEVGRPQNSRYLLTAHDFTTATAEPEVRDLLAEVHGKLLGLPTAADSEEVDRLYALWSDVHAQNGQDVIGSWTIVLSALFQDIRLATY